MQNLSPEIKQLAKSSMDKLNERKAAVDKERAGAESELSRARAIAKELERQIEQTKARASSKRSEPHAMRATRASEKGPGAPSSQEERDAAEYAEVSRELDRARRELLRLRLEVKSAAEAKTKAESDIVASAINIQSNLRAADEMKRLVDEANRSTSWWSSRASRPSGSTARSTPSSAPRPSGSPGRWRPPGPRSRRCGRT